MKKPLTDELVFVPLGGVGEIGMNMGAYGFGPANRRKWIVVDCGVSFGGPDLPGIELIMANPEFLEENADDVLALILTHSHEDHYGAVLDLWPGFEKPVYATAFTAAMLAAKRAADAIVDEVEVRPMQVGKPFTVGPFTVEPVVWQTMSARPPFFTVRMTLDPERGAAWIFRRAFDPLNVPVAWTCSPEGAGHGPSSPPQAGRASARAGVIRHPTASAAADRRAAVDMAVAPLAPVDCAPACAGSVISHQLRQVVRLSETPHGS